MLPRRVRTTAEYRWAYLDDWEPPIEGEEWKEIEFRGKPWKVSTTGRVKTPSGYTTRGAEGGPYLAVNGKMAHILVAQAFRPNPDNKRVVNHKDGNKRNNFASNLEWCTQAENVQHAFDIGLTPRECEKLKKVVVQLMPDGTTVAYKSAGEAERLTGVERNSIGAACRGVRELAGNFQWTYLEGAAVDRDESSMGLKN
jgi:hypothetical protein